MKRLLVPLAILAMACSTTPQVATVVPTAIPPTSTSQPTLTPMPTLTATPRPTATVMPTLAPAGPRLSVLGKLDSPDVRMVAFSPDGSLVAASSGNQANFAIKVWRTDDRSLVRTLDTFSGIVWKVVFSPDGQLLVSAADDRDKQHVRIWSAADGKPLKSLDVGAGSVNSLAFSPDGKLLAIGGLKGWPFGMVWFYDTANWKSLRAVDMLGQNVTALKFSPDGQTLASSGTDGSIRLWHVSDGTLIKQWKHAEQANWLDISPDGALLATVFCEATGTSGCTQGGVMVWRMSDGTLVRQFDDVAECVAFSPDGKWLVSGSGVSDPKLRLRNTADWTTLVTLDGAVNSLAMAANGKLLASADFRSVMLWSIER